MNQARFASTQKQQKTLSITSEQLVAYLNLKAPEAKCAYCGVGEYGVSPSPTGDTTAIVAAPVPNHKGLGVWFFPVSCSNCGFTAFFNTHLVVTALAEMS